MRNPAVAFLCAQLTTVTNQNQELASYHQAISAIQLILDELAELEKKCESITPDLDDFSTADIDVLAAAAQEAAFMVRLLLQFCRDEQTSYALRIARLALDTIDMYVQVAEGLDAADTHLNEKIAQHPVMVEELEQQETDLLRLTDVKTAAGLKEFRKRATHPVRSNIGLLVPADDL